MTSNNYPNSRDNSAWFFLTLITLSLWIVLIGIATRSFFKYEYLTNIISVVVLLIVNGFGIFDIDKIPIRQWLLKWCATSSVYKWRKLLTILLCLFALWEVLGLGNCYYNKWRFFSNLEQAWGERRNEMVGEMLGKAFATFPNRPEPFMIYTRIRNNFKELQDGKSKLNKFPCYFLSGSLNNRYWDRFPLLFCCSCINGGPYYLLRTFAMVEMGDFETATQHEPSPKSIHKYMLWLYHMSERFPDPNSGEYKQTLNKMNAVANDSKFHNSPVYPLILDHLFQLHYKKDGCSKSSLKVFKEHTANYIAYYKSLDSSDPISFPHKTFIYYLIRQVTMRSDIEQLSPFKSLNDEVQNFFNNCPSYINFLENLNEIEEFADKLKGIDTDIVDGGKRYSEMKNYLSDRKNISWMAIRLMEDLHN